MLAWCTLCNHQFFQRMSNQANSPKRGNATRSCSAKRCADVVVFTIFYGDSRNEDGKYNAMALLVNKQIV